MRKNFKKKVFFAFLIIGISFSAFIFIINKQKADAAVLTSFTVAPVTNNVDNLTGQTNASWRFSINNATAMSSSTNAVEITFPTMNGNWDFTGVTASSTALGGDSLQFATTTVAQTGERKIVIMAASDQTSADNNFVLDIKGVGNPMLEISSLVSSSWQVRTCVLNTAGNPATGCASDLDSSASANATLARRGGIINDWSYTANNYSAGATQAEYTVIYTASTTLNIGEKIHINFPVGFDLSAATTSAQTIVEGGSAQIAVDAVATSSSNGLNQIILTISNGAINPAATSTVTFKVGNITNPVKGAYQGFKIFTTTANNGLVDGNFYGMDQRSDYSPPPVDSIQIGGNNTVTGTVKVRRANGDLETITAEEAAQLKVGMGCPDLQFFAGTKLINSNGTFTYNNLLSATYILFVMPLNNSDKSFFDNYISPSMIQVNLTGGETAALTPTFDVPDGVIQGTITGGVANYSSMISVRAYSGTLESFSPVFTSTSYTTAGLNGSGTGYFEIPVKSGQTWNINLETSGTITDSGIQYWTPSVDPVFIPAGTATTTLNSLSFVAADKTLNVTVRKSLDNSVIDETSTPFPCLSVRRAGSEMMGPGGQGVCSTTLVNSVKVYQLKVPAGAFVIQLMMPGGFKEYPVTVLSSDTTISRTIVIQQATTYIAGTVTDPDSFAIQGASVMAQGSNGTFIQTLTNSSGVYTLYVPAGTYRVEAFAPGYGPLTALTNVIVSDGSNATGKNFTVSAGDFKTIKGRVFTDANSNGSYNAGETTYEGVHVHAFNSSGQNSSMTRSDGTYTLRVPVGTGYTIDAWSETLGFVGNLTNVNVSGDVIDKNFTPAAQGYLQIKITGGNTYGLNPVFAWAFNPSTGKGNGSDTWTATTSNADLVTKFNLPAGEYRVDIGTPVFGNLTSLAANINATTTTITANNTSNLIITLPDMITLSGITTANATVWASRTDGPGKFNTTADSSTGAYSMKIPQDFTYMVGASLPGYTNSPVTITPSANTTQNLTLTASSDTISGTVSSGGTPVSEGFVWATRANNTGWAGSEISANGAYSLAVDSGTWTVYADSPCKNPSSGTTQTGNGTVNISLTSISGCNYTPPEMHSVVPTTGSVISQSDVSVNIPPNALGSGSSNVSVSVAKPSIVPPATLNALPIGTSTKSILVTDSNGTAVTSLSNSIEISLTYSESDIPAGSSESNLQLAYWNTTTNTWDPVAATVDTTNNTLTAKVDHLTDFAPIIPTGEGAPDMPTGLTAAKNGVAQIDLAWTQVSGATSYLIYRDTASGGSYPYLTAVSGGSTVTYSNTGLSAGTAYYYKISASNTSGESSATSAATATTCTDVSNGTVSGSSCTLTCNAGYSNNNGTCVAASGGGGGGLSITNCASVTYDEWQTACLNELQYRNVLSQLPSGCSLTTEQENQRKRACEKTATSTPKTTLPKIAEGIKDRVSDLTDGASQVVSEFAQKIINIAAEAATIIKADINAILGKFGFKRDLAKESVSQKKYIKDLIADVKNISQNDQNKMNSFIAYGTPTTLKLGEGERAGVVNSFKSAYGKLPSSEAEWNDVVKIANGRWPSEINGKTETSAGAAFKKIYQRDPDRKNPNDDAAVMIIAYGLRPIDRNLNSEKVAIKSFKAIYGYAPKSATAWDIVRAIAYSGAKR